MIVTLYSLLVLLSILSFFHVALSIELPPGTVIPLGADNFDKEMSKSGASWLIVVHSPTCRHCVQMMPEFTKAAGLLREYNVYVGSIDSAKESTLAHRFPVDGFPTIYMIHGYDIREYTGRSRKASDFVDFATKGWKEAKAISFFTSPFGPIGYFKSKLIEVGLLARSFYRYLRNDMNLSLPSTIMLIGFMALVGTLVMMVVVVWLFTPPAVNNQPQQRLQQLQQQQQQLGQQQQQARQMQQGPHEHAD